MRKKVLSSACCAAVVAIAGLGAHGQAPGQQTPAAPAAPEAPAAGQQPIFRADINFVRVDVIVTDRHGTPVTDLQASDFEVLEDNRPQKVESFRLVQLDGTRVAAATPRPIRSRADEESAAADEDARIFVFFLDDYHVRLGSSMAARRHLIEFVQKYVGPGDLLAVMYPLTPVDAVTLTRDHASVVRMLERFEGRKYNYEPRNDVERRYSQYPTEVVERLRRQVSLSALEGLAVKLGSLRESRKALILVSEGYLAMLPPQMRDPIAEMPGLGNPARANPLAGENSLIEDRARMGAEMDLQRELRDVYDAANRSNTAIYAVDPRGLSTGEFDIKDNIGPRQSQEALRQTMDTLRVLADETDGRAIVNRNDLARGMQQIARDSSAYYLLGYTSTEAPQDGKFHEIRVRVRRPGLQVRARKGYWALTAEDVARATAPARSGPPPAVDRALASLAEPVRGRYVRTWIGTSPGENGDTRVTVVWEPLAVPPGQRRESASGMSLLAASPDGEVYYRGPVPASSISFDAPPGRLQLRMAILGPGNGTIDTDDRELIVPDLTAPEVRLSTPRLHVARNAREFRLMSQDAGTAPTATRDFRRTDRLLIRTDVVAPAGAPLTVSSRLLNRQGQPMADLPVAAPGAEGAPYVVDLPLSSLAPGEYLIEVSATSEGLSPATELVAFRVGS
ncbi:MAG: VWA domain-containing protein [Acidobacteriota bacterium]